MSCCLVVPHYNHVGELERFLPGLAALGHPVLLVDDGSDESAKQALRKLVQGSDSVSLVEHPRNRGKGAAVLTGFTVAASRGFTHALQIDADGQHNLDDIAGFIAASEANPRSIVCGKPVFDADAPAARVHGRKVTTFWTALETLSLEIEDGLCGFRVYPLDVVAQIVDAYYLGPRMDFDTEILVKAVWQDIDLRFLPTRVVYPPGATSHFHYLRDNLVLIRLHTRLMLGMLWRLPVLLARKLRRLARGQ
ncbi:glycosyltransferase family 2 protein [Mangrovimicrobium sediminis]|uniref:Glycosyltransferase family 2 protein n=1 Tax=Mangrovimicrobium sediminis TaxID=2562682 RepID=A0A4Z0LZ72_9GAMM|nr:glycosyltransferase family 2 protein [Haliea sp. SAOS-164]TGD72672.1 glycosyltransferase family 2 protein [Haliea sp. SAOS-164]